MRRPPLALAVLASLAFAGLGLPDGLLGVAWPSIRATFGLPLDALGALLVSFTAGYVVSSFSGGRLVDGLGLGRLLTLSCLATGGSLIGYATVPSWWMVVGLASLAGVGAGGIDTGINTYAATHYGPRMLNWLHACYGVGAASGPAIMTAIFAANLSWHRGYWVVGVAQLALATAFAATVRVWPQVDAGPTSDAPAPASIGETLRLPVARLGIMLFLVYTGLELAVGSWAFTLLTEGRGVAPMTAGGWASLYWGGLTTGRLLGAALATRIGLTSLLRGSVVVLAGGLALLFLGISPRADLAGLVIAGVAAGPMFPSLIAATPSRVGERHAANAVGFQIAAAALGQALLPSGVGLIGDSFGLSALAGGLVLLAVAVVLINEWLTRTLTATAGANSSVKEPLGVA